MAPLSSLLQLPLLVTICLLLATNIVFFLVVHMGREKITGKSMKKPNLPPSPPKLPLVGNLLQLGTFPHRSLDALSKKYGPLMLLYFGQVPAIVVSSAELAREVMKDHDLVFASRPTMAMGKRLMYNGKDVAFSPYGEYWRKVRKICVLQLLSTKRVQSFRRVREEEVEWMVEKIKASPNSTVNITEMIISLTNNIICRVAFGKKYSKQDDSGKRLHKVLKEFVALLGAMPFGDFIPSLGWLDELSGLTARAKKLFREMDAIADEVLADHLRSDRDDNENDDGQEGCYDFVQVLLSVKKEDSSIGWENIKAIIWDMFAAGTHTVSTAIVWTMAEMTRHPAVMKRAQEEVRGIIGGRPEVGEEDTHGMSYLKAVIKEAFRLRPPVPLLVPRESMEDINLHGYDIPAKTMVIINAWQIGRDPSLWDKPDEFLPERFMNQSIDFKGQDFQLIPFGAGRRGCPGIPFADPIIELVLANLLHRFDWEFPIGKKGAELDMSETPGMSVSMKSSLVLVAKPYQL